MSSIKFLRFSIAFLVAVMLTACNSPDFSQIKPDFSQVKGFSTSILNIGKKFNGSKNDDIADTAVDTPLPLHDILAGSLATENRGEDFLASIRYALESDPEIIAKRREVELEVRTTVALLQAHETTSLVEAHRQWAFLRQQILKANFGFA